jgi:hypothetical protein
MRYPLIGPLAPVPTSGLVEYAQAYVDQHRAHKSQTRSGFKMTALLATYSYYCWCYPLWPYTLHSRPPSCSDGYRRILWKGFSLVKDLGYAYASSEANVGASHPSRETEADD